MSHTPCLPSHARLRPFREADAPAVFELIHVTIGASYSGVYPERAIGFFQRHHALEEIRKRARNGCTVVVEAPGESGPRIVATGTITGDYIGGVFVHPGLQRSGCGRVVMEHLEQRARNAGLRNLTLDVSLPARGFYERLGYQLSDMVRHDVGEGQTLDYWIGRKTVIEEEPTALAAPDGPGACASGTAPAHSLCLNDDDAVSALDELSLWAAPFGLRLLEAFESGHGLRVLDVGFGTGFPLLELAGRLGASSTVHGLDPWVAGHRRTRFRLTQLGLANVELAEGTAERMPFPADFFDRAVSNNGFNNVADMAQAFRETARVCRPGAQLVFTMNLDGSMHELHDVFRPLLAEWQVPEGEAALAAYIYHRRKPLDEVRAQVEAAGFHIESIQHDEFGLRYADGTAMLAHPFIRIAFLDGWRALVPESRRDAFFAELERRLNTAAADRGELRLSIPFVTVVARRL